MKDEEKQEKAVKNAVFEIVKLAADYGGCASRMIPAYEATTVNTNFPDTLSEFRSFLVDFLAIIFGLVKPTEKTLSIACQLAKTPERAYDLFRQFNNANQKD